MVKIRILIVEDETIVALDIQDRLTELGYEVTGMAHRGDEALTLAASTRPDLVLMDINLKGEMDGIGAAEVMRQRFHIPVIYLTAFSDDNTLQRAKITEPFGYIIKPFEDREIQSAIEMALYKHQAEERLRQSERRYATTLSSIGDGVIATDSLGGVTFMNPVAEKLTGYPLAEAHGRPLVEMFQIVNEETRQTVANPIAKVLREGKVVGLANHTILIGRDGSETPIDDCASPILDDHGQITGTVLVFQDVSERRRKEAERLQMERHLLHTQKLESLGVLAGGIAHDFNNLLMAILGHADLSLIEVSPVSPIRSKLQEIIKASHRAADLCRQMLAYSGKGQFVIEHMYLNEVIQEMIHMLKTSISKKVLLNLNLEKMAPTIEGDPSQIRQVLMNLVINGSEAIGEKSGVVTVSTGAKYCDDEYLQETFHLESLPAGLYVSVEVSDTGCGMNRETQSRIFEPFFTTKFTGRGLGMSAVLGIMRGHKGALKVYSEPGKGTTFRLLFPASTEAGDESSGEAVEPGSEWRGSGMVLLVDDEETVLGVGRLMLEKLGYTVITAWDGREAVTIYRSRSDEIAFVVMDLTMPHMNGEEAFRELRRIDPNVKVFISSGYSEWEISARFAGKSLAGFIQKPYQMAGLRRVLEEH